MIHTENYKIFIFKIITEESVLGEYGIDIESIPNVFIADKHLNRQCRGNVLGTIIFVGQWNVIQHNIFFQKGITITIHIQ